MSKKVYKTFKVEKDGEEKELGVTEFVAIENRDRLSACALTEEGTYLLEQYNTEDTDREPHAQLHLTKKSLTGVVGAAIILLENEDSRIYKILDRFFENNKTKVDASYKRREEEE